MYIKYLLYGIYNDYVMCITHCVIINVTMHRKVYILYVVAYISFLINFSH